MDKVAVITGANKGIGFEVCRQLAKAGVNVVLTARNEGNGKAAVNKLSSEGLKVSFFKLDVSDVKSFAGLFDYVSNTFGRLDIFVNNAAVMLDKGGAELGPIAAESAWNDLSSTMETNVYGPFALCLAMAPLMKKNQYGRIVNVSSGLGQLSEMRDGHESYRISKTAINAVTRVMAAKLGGDGIKVNSVCPGWVRTDMGGPNAPRTVEEGADTIVWLATLPDKGPTGGFFRDRKPISW